MNADAPEIETERLLLKGRTRADFDDYAAMWREPAVVRFTTGEPLGREEAWRAFGRLAGVWRLCGYGPWIVREKATGAFVGDVGPADYARDCEPRLEPMVEFGWALAPSMHGKGYAQEAIRATVDWTRRFGPREAFCAIIDPDNLASQHVAAKIGFRRAGPLAYKGKTIDLLRLQP